MNTFLPVWAGGGERTILRADRTHARLRSGGVLVGEGRPCPSRPSDQRAILRDRRGTASCGTVQYSERYRFGVSPGNRIAWNRRLACRSLRQWIPASTVARRPSTSLHHSLPCCQARERGRGEVSGSPTPVLACGSRRGYYGPAPSAIRRRDFGRDRLCSAERLRPDRGEPR